MTKKTAILALLFASLISVQAVIWVPEVAHYHVSALPPSPAVVDRAIMDRNDSLTSLIRRVDFSLVGDLSDIETVLTAESILTGTLRFPRTAYYERVWPFEKNHLLLGNSGFQLKMAGLAWAELAIDAWWLTRDDKYLNFAEENVLRFIRFEDRRILPIGYLWNDHAVANRAVVYAQLWAALKNRGPVQRETTYALLRAVDRTARLLAKPSHYTFRTNHGVMQNVALIVTAAAFPWLEEAGSYLRTGNERLARQMNYFISNRGAVLEHSAGYHEFGVGLLRSCFELLGELSMPVPAEWQTKIQRAEEWLRVLARPDHSFPNFGDSEPSLGKVGLEIVGDQNLETRRTDNAAGQVGRNGLFLMDAGYAVFRAAIGTAADVGIHAAIAWSHFVSRAHKHADELSIHYWANGVSWWTSSGYWPYEDPLRDSAVGWAGSNAPHYVGEQADSERSSSLVSFGDGGEYSIWILRRQNKDGYVVSRQAVFFRDEWALAVDVVSDQKFRQTEIIWGSPPNITITRRGERSALLLDHASGQALGVSVDATAPFELSVLRQSTVPFGGWMASEGAVKGASAIRTLSQANSVLVTGWADTSQGRADASSVDVEITDWQGANRWTVDLHIDGRRHKIQRIESSITVANGDSSDLTLHLKEPSVDQSLSTEVEAYRREVSMAQVYADYLPWRLRVSYYCLYLFFGLALSIAFISKKRTATLFPLMIVAVSVGSLTLGAYLHFVYFVP